MQQQDETHVTGASIEPMQDTERDVLQTSSMTAQGATIGEKDFDWLALGVVLIVAALFAVAARLNAQPPTSLTPIAVLSATGCGLLVTAIRKLRTPLRPGLREATLGGLFMALFQFIAALSYPNVIVVLSEANDERLGFLTTWGLILAFTIVFSIIGATLGHLAFAPLRPLPVKKQNLQNEEAPKENNAIETTRPQEQTEGVIDDLNEVGEDRLIASDEEGTEPSENGEEIAIGKNVENIEDVENALPQRSLVSYLIAVLLLGLAPLVVGYIFSAAFDYMLTAYQFFPGPYPTLRLLSALLPWQIPVAFTINSTDPNSLIFLMWQLWRFPVFLGNPTIFDVQALEPLVFNGAALGLLVLTVRDTYDGIINKAKLLSWPIYLLLEFLLGLLLVLPADLWIVRGLQGLLQNPVIATPIRTLTILDQSTFLFNLITGPIVCLGIGILLRFSRREKTLKQ